MKNTGSQPALRNLSERFQMPVLTSRADPSISERNGMLRKRTTTIVAASALAVGVATGAGGYAALSDGTGATASPTSAPVTSPAASTTSSLSVGQIYERAHEGVVEITVTSQTQGPS